MDNLFNLKPSDENTRVPSAASHSTTEMDADTLNSMVAVQHLGGTSKKKRFVETIKKRVAS